MLQGKNDKVALFEGNNELTYGDLKQEINRYSNLFSDLENKHIAIFAENSLNWIYAFYAIWKNHNVPVPIDYMSGVDDIAFIINDCKPELIFCSGDRKASLLEALREVNFEPRLIVFDEIKSSDESNSSEITFPYKDDDTAVIIYTSGTTGSPKGVMLSYENLKSNMVAVSEKVKIYTPNERIMMLLPLHHIFPLLGSLIMPLYVGATIAVAPSLSADDIIKTLQKFKVTMLIGVPRLYSIIRKGIIDKIQQSFAARTLFKLAGSIKWRAFSKKVFNTVHQKFGGNLTYMIAGGAPLDPEVAVDFRTLGFEILEGYGMTEAAPMITFTRPGKFKAGSAGHALPGTSIEVRDGEIVAAGKNIMQGYFNRPGETAEILRDGWLYTGDLGYLDKKGRIYITGRRKEIIVLSNGKNINPAEIENKIESISPLVKEAAVFLMKDKLNLIIVPEEQELKRQKIEDPQKYFRDNVLKPYNEKASSSKRLLKLHISQEELPKTRLSKIKRFQLVDFVEGLTPTKIKKVEKIDSKELQTLIDFIAQQAGQDVFPSDTISEDIALDSLAKITLLVYIENTFGVEISEEKLAKFQTIKELGDYITEHKTMHKHEVINWAHILKHKVSFNLPKAGLSFNFVNWSYRAFSHSFFRLRKEGAGNIPDGPCILVPNHQSMLDGFFLASVLRRKTMRATYFYAKEKHWSSAFRRFLARKNNVILMDINKDLKLSLQKMAEVLRKGKNLIIFPEGKRSSDGELNTFKQTFAILAAELNVPVVPVAIQGANEALPVGKLFPRFFKKISVKFLDPVYPKNMSYESLKDTVERLVAGQLS